MTVLIVTDNPLFTLGLQSVIKDCFADAEIIEIDMLQKTLALAADTPVQIMVLDVAVPGGKDITILKAFKEFNPQTSVLVNLGDRLEYVYLFVRAKVNGLISRRSDETEIQDALRTITSQTRFISSDIQQLILSHITENLSDKGLTEKEKIIADLLIGDTPVSDIALIMALPPYTITSYRTKIFQKLRVRSIQELKIRLTKVQSGKSI
jgi:DNA-binding NarL/FixJ family response regulator